MTTLVAEQTPVRAPGRLHKIHIISVDRPDDQILRYNPDDPADVDRAKGMFSYCRGHGMLAHTAPTDANPGEMLTEFDPHAAVIVFRPALQGG